MAGTVEKKLAELGIVLPAPAAPVANYVPFVRTGNFMVVSGQLCLDADGKLVAKGQLGGGVSIEDGQKAARACAINLLAQLKAALGDLDKVARVVRLGGFINSAPGFRRRPEGDERRLRPDGRGLRRQGPPRPHHGRRRGAAARRRGRGRRRVRSAPEPSRDGHARLADRAADRPSRPARRRRRRDREHRRRRSAPPSTAGYGIECDLQISADGEAMVHHDDALGRLTDGSGRLDAHDRRRRSSASRSKPPPTACSTLGELCDLVAGRVTLVIEIKSRFDGDTRLAARTAEVLAGYRGPVAAMSFDPGADRDAARGCARARRAASWRHAASAREWRTRRPRSVDLALYPARAAQLGRISWPIG